MNKFIPSEIFETPAGLEPLHHYLTFSDYGLKKKQVNRIVNVIEDNWCECVHVGIHVGKASLPTFEEMSGYIYKESVSANGGYIVDTKRVHVLYGSFVIGSRPSSRDELLEDCFGDYSKPIVTKVTTTYIQKKKGSHPKESKQVYFHIYIPNVNETE